MNTTNVSLSAAATQHQPVTPVSQPVQTRQVAAAVRAINTSPILGSGREMTLSIDPSTKLPVVRILDSSTREVIQQIPTEVVLRITSALESEAAQAAQPQKTYF